jgi:thiol-disulfide isomerase/thioredoxin
MTRQRLMWALVMLFFAGLGAFVASRQGPATIATAVPPDAAHANPVARLLASQWPTPSGQMQSLASWRGKPLIVNFWASWCPPCVKEMPELAELAQQLQPKGIFVLGMGVDTAEHIQTFLAKHQITYPQYVLDTKGIELSQQLGNESGGLPFTVLIDSNGVIKKTYLGGLDFVQLRRDIAQEFK